MAKVDWYGYAEQFQSMIQDNLPNLMVTIEEAKPAGLELNPSVSIYVKGREVPAELQTLSGFTETRYMVTFEILVWAFHLEGIRQACELRDDTIGDIEQILQTASNWESFANSVLLEGGEFETGPDIENGGLGYYAAGSINFRVDVTHTQ